MAMQPEPPDNSMNRGLLTKAQREFLRGEKEDVDEDSYRYNLRSDFRTRMSNLAEDLELLREAGEDQLVEEFYERFDRVGQLEQEVEELREKVDRD